MGRGGRSQTAFRLSILRRLAYVSCRGYDSTLKSARRFAANQGGTASIHSSSLAFYFKMPGAGFFRAREEGEENNAAEEAGISARAARAKGKQITAGR